MTSGPPTHKYRTWYRCRDLAAGLVVLIIGGAMINTVYTRGEGDSVTMALQAFALGILLLIVAYSSGFVSDRLGRRYPVLVRPRSSLRFVLTLGLVATLGYSYVEFQEQVHATFGMLLR